LNKTLLIAEIGHNWVPDFDKAFELILMTRNMGWDVAKFQAYDTDKIKQPGDTNYKELKEAELSFNQLKALRDYCDKNDVEFMASAFDVERVLWLEELSVKRHKIASRSIYDSSLIEAMEKTGKPIIASLANWLGRNEFPKISNAQFLYCKSRRQILQNGFKAIDMIDAIKQGCGFSDHTIGTECARLAIDYNAPIIEKHITLDKNAAGWDQPSSADYFDMKEIRNAVRRKRGVK